MGLDPTSFWAETPGGFAATMRGRISARKAAYDLALFGAWQGERMHREDRLQPLGEYLKRREPDNPQTSAERLAVFQTLAAGGVGLKIERIR